MPRSMDERINQNWVQRLLLDHKSIGCPIRDTCYYTSRGRLASNYNVKNDLLESMKWFELRVYSIYM